MERINRSLFSEQNTEYIYIFQTIQILVNIDSNDKVATTEREIVFLMKNLEKY